MEGSRKVPIRPKPSAIVRYFPYLKPGESLDRVEAAFLASLKLIEGAPEEYLKEDRDVKAFLVLHDLARMGKLFRVEYPRVKVLSGNTWKTIGIAGADEELDLEELSKADYTAIVDLGGDVIYYEVREAKL